MDNDIAYLTNFLDSLGIVFEGIRREKIKPGIYIYRVFITNPISASGIEIIEDTFLLEMDDVWPGELVLIDPTFPGGSLKRGKSQILDYLFYGESEEDDTPPDVSDYEEPPYFK